MSLNEAQSRAVAHYAKPMLVLAGPGSGKTLVITERTKHLIEQYGVPPQEILVITFTKAAAMEMKERFCKKMDGQRVPVTFGTFHAIYFGILKHAYNLTAANILREDQKNQFLREIISKLDVEPDDEADFISEITNEISQVKNNRILLEHYYSTSCSEEDFRTIYNKYAGMLEKKNLIDFDDMLVMCYELLSQRGDILKGWQSKFKYILIDEFQDINQIQYDVIKLLALPENNLFIVGDDDQSIYRFRGARPEIMLGFEKDYPDSETILLDMNYRCTGAIVEGSKKVISNNKDRYEKNIKAHKETGQDIEIKTFSDQEEENEHIIHQIQEFIKQGREYSDFAILFRTNIGPRRLLERIMEYNIPFKMKDKIPNIYEHWIVKNLITYIKMAEGSRERKDFLQIMNRPKRYISREYLDNAEISFDSLRTFYYDKDWMLERIDKLEYDLSLLGKMVPYSAINYIRHGIGYEEYLKEYAAYRRMKFDDLIDILNEVQESAKSYKTYDEWFAHIEKYEKELLEQSKNRENNHNSITFATMHSSKGLEFKIVYLIDINEGICPHRKAVVEADMAEERRMFYVGMTRAKEQLKVYSIKEHYSKKVDISRFVGEILINKQDLVPGVKIYHKKYGEGIIKLVDDGKMSAAFKKANKLLTLDINYCITNQIIKVIV